MALLIVGSAWAESDPMVAAELQALGRALAESKALRFVVQIEFYQDVNQAAPSFRQTIEVSRLGSDLLYKQPRLTMLANPARTIVVDFVRKEIHYRHGKPTKDLPSGLPPDGLGQALEQLAAQGAVLRHEGTAGGEIRLVASAPRGEIRRAELFLDARTHLPVRVQYRYAPSGTAPEARAEIRYRWLDASSLSPADFAESAFVRFEAGRALPSDAYPSFEVIWTPHAD